MQLSKNRTLLTLAVLFALGLVAPQQRNGNNDDEREDSAVDEFLQQLQPRRLRLRGQSEGDSGEPTCQLNSNRQVVCSDISGASNIIRKFGVGEKTYVLF